MCKKIILFFLILTSYFLLLATNINAADFKSDYQVEYFLKENQQSLSTHVRFNIQITNLVSDLYVTKFSIIFPKSFHINNITGSDDTGSIEPKVSENESGNKIDLEFKNPKTGRDSINNFYLQFDQDNLFTVNGNVWEVILPTVENKGDSSYKILVNLPDTSDKKISLAKPKPDLIIGKQIIWNNPKERTIYAIFGDIQQYSLDLTYHIVNPKLYPVFTEVAFIPDTQYQKTYINSISEMPVSVRQDEDGNYLAKYFLGPRETKTIIYNGTVDIYTNPRQEILPYIRKQFESQQKYLLTETPYWSIGNSKNIPQSRDLKSIYDFTVNTLKYNYDSLGKTKERLGASRALSTPEQSVCVEYSDVFIALAREAGIYSREMEGYGYSQDTRLRPLSLNTDILHSWPEYYDKVKELWTPIDPTWEHTSGIDYFSSFDLNHIVFVIHGRKSDYPLPAGMYKVENSKDILIKPMTIAIKDNKELVINFLNIPKEISDNFTEKSSIFLTNKSNVYLWNIPITIKSSNLSINVVTDQILSLAPYEKFEIPIEYTPTVKNKKILGEISIKAGVFEASKTVQIVPYYYGLVMKLFVISLVLGIPVVGILVYRKLKENKVR